MTFVDDFVNLLAANLTTADDAFAFLGLGLLAQEPALTCTGQIAGHKGEEDASRTGNTAASALRSV